MSVLILTLGFIFLIKGADFFVEGSSSLAKRFHIPSLVIGLTIVAMGTSLPELSVSFTSALQGRSDMSIANAIGSNIFNILAIIGCSSLFCNLPVPEKIVKSDARILLVSTLSLLVLSFIGCSLSLVDGLILLSIFSYFILGLVKNSRGECVEVEETSKPLLMTLFFIVIGALGIIYGGTLVVNNATIISKSLGMSDNLIGLTVVAVGTSLPEFVTSVVATRKGELDIAIGNVVGSNIFNILFVLGISSLFNNLTVSYITLIDIMFSSILTGLFLVIGTKFKKVNKRVGIFLIITYITYITYTIIR